MRRQRVPRILHQTWKTSDIPEELTKYVASWKRYNPDWEFRFWNDTQGLALIEQHYPWFYKHIDKFKSGVEKADIMRYFILYHHGGVYADLDMECLRPWEPLLRRHDENFQCVLGAEPQQHAQKQGSRNMLVCNAMMFSVAGHPFWEEVFNKLLDRVPELGHASGGDWVSPVDTTGPVMLSELYEAQPTAYRDVAVYPSTAFYPLKDNHDKYKAISTDEAKFRQSWAVHRWHHLWLHGKHHHHDKSGSAAAAEVAWQADTGGLNGDGKYHSVTEQISPTAAAGSVPMSSSQPPLLFCQPRIVPSRLHDMNNIAYGTSTVSTESDAIVNVGQASTHRGGTTVGGVAWMEAIKLDVLAVSRKKRRQSDKSGGHVGGELGGLPIARRGKVDLGSSTTGTATFAVNFEGDEMLASEPIVLVHPRMQKVGCFVSRPSIGRLDSVSRLV
jgi:mannosyltransferase OCH1-like enzyme